MYIDFSSDDLVVTRAKRVLDGAQKVEGVVATDVSLKEIDNFISSLNLSDKARAFIVELDGKLLASNSQDTVIKDRDGNTQRISALNSGDDVIANAYSKVVKLIDQDYLHKRGRSHYVTTAKDNNGKLISVAAEHISDDAGLNWIALVAIPHEETFGAIHKQLWFGIAVGLLAFVLVAMIGIRIFDRISRHVTELSNNITRMRKGDLEVSVPTSRKDEIGDLARNFNSMHQEIFTDKLTQLANRTALNSVLNQYTNPEQSQPFLLLFVDLNKFKPLNDNYGHDNGDKALIEVASRLKAALRDSDFVARLGGDEFVLVLLGSYSNEEINLLLAKIQSTVEAPLTTLMGVEDEVCVGAAIGIARYPEDAENAHTLLKIADKAMYKNKERSR